MDPPAASLTKIFSALPVLFLKKAEWGVAAGKPHKQNPLISIWNSWFMGQKETILGYYTQCAHMNDGTASATVLLASFIWRQLSVACWLLNRDWRKRKELPSHYTYFTTSKQVLPNSASDSFKVLLFCYPLDKFSTWAKSHGNRVQGWGIV